MKKWIAVLAALAFVGTSFAAQPPKLDKKHPKLVEAKEKFKKEHKELKKIREHLIELGVMPESATAAPPLSMKILNPIDGAEIGNEWPIFTPFTVMILNACGGQGCIGLHVCQVYYPPIGYGPQVEYDVYADVTQPGLVNLTQWERIDKAPGGEATPTMIQNPHDYISSSVVGAGVIDCWGYPAGTVDPIQIGLREIEFVGPDPLAGAAGNGLVVARDMVP